jgi:hypothetical protein
MAAFYMMLDHEGLTDREESITYVSVSVVVVFLVSVVVKLQIR